MCGEIHSDRLVPGSVCGGHVVKYIKHRIYYKGPALGAWEKKITSTYRKGKNICFSITFDFSLGTPIKY